MTVEKQRPFDLEPSRAFTEVRKKFIGEFLKSVEPRIRPGSALDVGCGVGDFSRFLSDQGFKVVAVDGREENAAEAKRRHPGITFLTGNAEDLPVAEMGTFDLVLCFGLLYHLENPFRAIRNLHAVTGTVLMVESMCAPGVDPKLELLDEHHGEDQGLNYVAFYPSESCLVKMLYRAGFPFVYGFQPLPAHKLYQGSIWRKRERTMMAASRLPLTAPNLLLAKEIIRQVPSIADPWMTILSRSRYLLGRLRRWR
jgi:SAM-dependent methyltransferase